MAGSLPGRNGRNSRREKTSSRATKATRKRLRSRSVTVGFVRGTPVISMPTAISLLKGRLKEQINRGGEKIIPQEIDDVLAAHPEIEQAASFSMKHATLGEDVGAAIVLRENSSLDEGAIRRYVASQLSDFKVPKTILFLPSLPRCDNRQSQARHAGSTRELGLGEPLLTCHRKTKLQTAAPKYGPRSWA